MNKNTFSTTGFYIRSITQNVNIYLESRLRPLGIGHGQFEYFLLIAANEGINQNELAQTKNVGKASVTKAVKKLENEGFIQRVIDQKDKRNFQLHCTEKGRNAIDDLLSYKSEIEKVIFDNFSAEDIEKLNNNLKTLNENSMKLMDI